MKSSIESVLQCMCMGVHICTVSMCTFNSCTSSLSLKYRCILTVFTEILLQILGGLYSCGNNSTLPILDSVFLDTVQWNDHICKVDESIISGNFSIPVLLLCTWMG